MKEYQLKVIIFLLIVVAVSSLDASALDVYDARTLQRANQTYADKIRLVWRDMLDRLTIEERQTAGNVKLNLPLVGSDKLPFEYSADVGRREVTIPIMSVKFFDDLAIAEAWLTRRGCATDPVSDYVGILRYQGSSLSPGNRFPPPLKALGIPQNALDDAFVDDVSGKMLKSAIYFIMAHELAHVVHQHKPYNMITRQEAQAQEAKADEFAINLMRKISVPPIGMVLFFTVCCRFEPAPGDFPNLQEYESFVRQTTTHPLTSQRLLAISKGVRSNADAFSQGQKDPISWRLRLIKIADDIEVIGNTLDDRKIRELQKHRGQTIKMGDLSATCPLKSP